MPSAKLSDFFCNQLYFTKQPYRYNYIANIDEKSRSRPCTSNGPFLKCLMRDAKYKSQKYEICVRLF
jgi:hypothetical protein